MHQTPRTNQEKREPLPASPEERSCDGIAVERNEELGGSRTGGHAPAAVPAAGAPASAPGVQVAQGEIDADRKVRKVRLRYVANAVPGKPDGEVDTRS